MSDQDSTPDVARTKVSPETRDAERHEATMPADAGPEPTAEESALAEGNEVDPEVAAANKDAIERGANVAGEGRID